MKKILSIIFITILLVGCSGSGDKNDTKTIKYKQQEIIVPKKIQKIAVFDMAALDMLDTLKVDVAGVATTMVPDYLSKYKDAKYVTAGGSHEADLEALSSLKPDLVILSGRTADSYDKVKEIAPTILLESDSSKALESYKENAKAIGELVSKEKEVEDILAEQDKKIQDMKSTINKDTKALLVLTSDKQISAYGTNSRFALIHDILQVTPADKNIETSTHGQAINLEYISKVNPDVIYVIDRNKVVGKQEGDVSILDNKLVNGTKAAKNKKIYDLDPSLWYLTGISFQSLDKMLDELVPSFK